jgi:hypothetical protein
MTELVTVKGSTYNSRVALWERNPDHPSGEAYIADGMVAQVALTPEVQARIGSGLLVVTDESPTEPFEGYTAMSAEKIAAQVEKMGDIERIVVRQYEATHGKRKIVTEAEPAPIEGYDALTVADVLAAKAGMTPEQWDVVREYEASHKNRKSVIEAL